MNYKDSTPIEQRRTEMLDDYFNGGQGMTSFAQESPNNSTI